MVDDDTGLDPQLPILLRTLFEKGQEQEALTRGAGAGAGAGASSLSNSNLRNHSHSPHSNNNSHNPPSQHKTASIAEAMVSTKLARVLCRAGDDGLVDKNYYFLSYFSFIFIHNFTPTLYHITYPNVPYPTLMCPNLP